MSWNRGWLIKSSVLIWKGVSATLQSGRYTFSCPRGHTMQGYYSQMRACDRIVKFWFWMKSWDDGVRDKHLWWTVTQTMVYSDCDVTVTALFRLWHHGGCPIQTVTSQWLPYSDCDVTVTALFRLWRHNDCLIRTVTSHTHRIKSSQYIREDLSA